MKVLLGMIGIICLMTGHLVAGFFCIAFCLLAGAKNGY
jgi:hypothetical protein